MKIRHTKNTPDEEAILSVLANHPGRKKAISADALAAVVDIRKRLLRTTINHLIIEHGIQIGSAAGHDGGYFLIVERTESLSFRWAFEQRAITGLMKAAAISGESLLETAQRLAERHHRDQGNPDTAGERTMEGLGATVRRALEIIGRHPELYRDDIQVIRRDFGEVIIERARLEKINETARKLQELTFGLIH